MLADLMEIPKLLLSTVIPVAHAALPPVIAPVGSATGGGATAAGSITSAYGSIFSIMTLLAGALAVLYVLWAGIQYIMAAGSADKVKAARATLINAIIGVIIITAAYFFIKLAVGIGNTAAGLGGASTTSGNAECPLTDGGTSASHHDNCCTYYSQGQTNPESADCFQKNCSDIDVSSCTLSGGSTNGGSTTQGGTNGGSVGGTTSGGTGDTNGGSITAGGTVSGDSTSGEVTTTFGTVPNNSIFTTTQTTGDTSASFTSPNGVVTTFIPSGDGSMSIEVDKDGNLSSYLTISPNGSLNDNTVFQADQALTGPPTQSDSGTRTSVFANGGAVFTSVHKSGENKAFLRSLSNYSGSNSPSLIQILPSSSGSVTIAVGPNGQSASLNVTIDKDGTVSGLSDGSTTPVTLTGSNPPIFGGSPPVGTNPTGGGGSNPPSGGSNPPVVQTYPSCYLANGDSNSANPSPCTCPDNSVQKNVLSCPTLPTQQGNMCEDGYTTANPQTACYICNTLSTAVDQGSCPDTGGTCNYGGNADPGTECVLCDDGISTAKDASECPVPQSAQCNDGNTPAQGDDCYVCDDFSTAIDPSNCPDDSQGDGTTLDDGSGDTSNGEDCTYGGHTDGSCVTCQDDSTAVDDSYCPEWQDTTSGDGTTLDDGSGDNSGDGTTPDDGSGDDYSNWL